MKRLSRDEFAAAALTGILARGTRFTNLDKIPAKLAFSQADAMLALSAPDAIEALERLVEAVRLVGLSENNHVSKAVATANAVLARYKEPSG